MIAQADAVHIPLADESVHCVVTSPPYWGLRKYSGDQGEEPLGLESTPERHVERMVEICREVRRVLRGDGVFWLNYGDCYAGSWGNYGSRDGGQRAQNVTKFDRPGSRPSNERPATSRVNVPQGSLMMMPHRVALALQQDGWIVRQDLVWFKRNPMPESVNGWRWQRERTKKDRSKHAKDHNIKGGTEAMLRDASIHQGISPDWVPDWEYGDDLELKRGSWRHTRAHEYIFQCVKSMQYFSNQEAVRERIGDSGIIEGSYLPSQFSVLVQDLGLRYPTPIGTDISVTALAVADFIFEICILHSGAGFELVELKENIGLPFLDPQKWIDGAQYLHSTFAVSHPAIGFTASLIGRFASDDLSAEEFLRQLDSLWIALPDGDEMKEMWRLADFGGRLIGPDGNATVRIDDTSEIGEINLFHTNNNTHNIPVGQGGRNPRSVLDVPTAPYKGAHYATFPPNLIAPLIRATCPRWACPVCGQGWAVVVDQAFVPQEDVSLEKGIKGHDGQKPAAPENRWDGTPRGSNQNNVLGYRPTCPHGHTQEEAVPGICFDPFVGSGTTVAVAKDLLRRGIGIDISMEYLDQQAKVRAGLGTPSNALEDLPLFENLLE